MLGRSASVVGCGPGKTESLFPALAERRYRECQDAKSPMPKKAVQELEAVAQPKPAPGRLVRLCVAAWLIPGCGHLLLGRRGRAAILFASILSMFLLGLAMQGQFFSTGTGSYLKTLGFFGEMCVGIAMPAAMFLGYAGGNPYFVSSDYGTAFLVGAGMLNVLTVFDAYDIALGRKP